MKIIPLLGIINCFFPLIFFNSKRALLVFINGIIFHSMDVNKINNQINTPFVNYFKYYDIFCNIAMISYTTYYYPYVLKYTIIACLCYIIEVICVNNTNMPYYKTDLIHVIVHIILAYGIVITL